MTEPRAWKTGRSLASFSTEMSGRAPSSSVGVRSVSVLSPYDPSDHRTANDVVASGEDVEVDWDALVRAARRAEQVIHHG